MNSASLSAMHMSQSFHTISPLLKYSRLTFENGLAVQRSYTAGILSYFFYPSHSMDIFLKPNFFFFLKKTTETVNVCARLMTYVPMDRCSKRLKTMRQTEAHIHAIMYLMSFSAYSLYCTCSLQTFCLHTNQFFSSTVSTPFMWQHISGGTYGGKGAACHL